MKTILSIALLTTLFAANASAKNVHLRPADNSFETQICYTAATEGLSAARTMIRNSDENYARFTDRLLCNGKSLVRTAKMYNQKQEVAPQEQVVKVKFVTDEAPESQVCLDAVVMGVGAALEKHGLVQSSIICNGRNIESFAKKFEGRTVAL